MPVLIAPPYGDGAGDLGDDLPLGGRGAVGSE
jgi:hypothetical protein